jgi:hypothetical protein
MKFATAAAGLSLIAAASLLAPGYSSAQDIPPSVQMPQSKSDQPNNIRSSSAPRRTGAQFIAQPAGSASGAAASATVAQRFAPTAQPASGTANSK